MVDYNDSAQVELRKNQEDPIVMYLIVREELGMSIGKTAAQCGHAAQMVLLAFIKMKQLYNCFTEKDHEQAHMQDVLARLNIFEQWLDSSFRKVVLKADEKEWHKVQAALVENVFRFTVIDAGLTELKPNTETVMGIWPMRKSEVPKVLKKLQVLK